MSAVVADTHAVLWLVFAPPQLSAQAMAALQRAVQGGLPIYLSSITIVEVTYLVEKGKLPISALTQLLVELA